MIKVVATFLCLGIAITKVLAEESHIPPSNARIFPGVCDGQDERYMVAGQCDAYVECVKGQAYEKLCPDGLMFYSKTRLRDYACQYPNEVDCAGREKLQAPEPTQRCPHQFAKFRIGDSAHCNTYIDCENGIAHRKNCGDGLAFHPTSHNCVWPGDAPDCDAPAFLGFQCPQQVTGDKNEVQAFVSPDDCQRYFVCVDGKPRLNICGPGSYFDEFINDCAPAEQVAACKEGVRRR